MPKDNSKLRTLLLTFMKSRMHQLRSYAPILKRRNDGHWAKTKAS